MRRLLALALVLVMAAGAPAATDDVQDVVYLGDGQVLLIRLHIRSDGKPFRAVWEDAMSAIFTTLDRNGDGFLDKKEAERIPPPATLLGNGQIFFNPGIPQVIDRNNDGKISRDELVRHYRDSGLTPFQVRPDPRAGMSYATYTADGVVYTAGPGFGREALTQRLFSLLDTDKDGKLSARELAAAPTVLGKLDSNDDEMVSTAELQSQSPANVVATNVVAFAPGGMISAPPGGPFLAVQPGKVDRVLAGQLLARYGGGKPGKAPRKTLRREDLGLSAETFARLDADGNGTLDTEELARFAQRSPDLEVLFRLGKRDKDEASLERFGASARGGRVERNVDGTLALAAGVTRLQVHCTDLEKNRLLLQQMRLQYKTQFLATDQDKNGYLDAREVMQNYFFYTTFKAMDRDGDGKLFEKEIIAFLDESYKMQELVAGSCVALQVQDQGQGLFSLVDTNRDGRLSVRELRQMGKLVAQLDRDGSGKIGPSDLPRIYRLDLTRGLAQNPQFRSRVVRLPGGMPQSPTPPSPTGPTWFRKMDRNGDGDVSRREFLGSEEQFRRLDADGDGLISLEEAAKADAALRKSSR